MRISSFHGVRYDHYAEEGERRLQEPAAMPLTTDTFAELQQRLEKLEAQATAPLREQVCYRGCT